MFFQFLQQCFAQFLCGLLYQVLPVAGLDKVLQPDDASVVRCFGKIGLGIEVRNQEFVHQNDQRIQCARSGVAVTGNDTVDNRHQYCLLLFGSGVELVKELFGR